VALLELLAAPAGARVVTANAAHHVAGGLRRVLMVMVLVLAIGSVHVLVDFFA
jgi:hypothetical protein